MVANSVNGASLPSPAPSDEGYSAGTATGRRTTEDVALNIPAPSTSASASPIITQSSIFTPHSHQHFTNMGAPQATFQVGMQPQSQSRQFQQPVRQHSPLQTQWQWQRQGQRQGSHSRTNSINPSATMSGVTARPLRTPSIVPSNHHGHPMPTQMHISASRRASEDLLDEISRNEKSLSQAGRLTPTNNGRLLLLKDAVSQGDWFYQILSQLFCLRTLAPDTLPQSIRGVDPESFEMLDALLCSNKDVDPELLRFFARFPEPIMNIYSNPSGEARELYEDRLRMVKDFLTKLPLQWHSLVRGCQALQAPPLVQDMIETLGLQSVILQTTAFRAIARMFWGLGETKGIRALEQLHRLDQETFYRQGWRRNQAEKNVCYQHYQFILQKWLQAAGEQRANFITPPEVLQYFKQIPQSTLLALQQRQHQQHQQQQQRQAQQISQAQMNNQLLSPTLQNQHQMQIQMQMNAQARAQGGHSPIVQQQSQNYTPQMPMAPPGQQMPLGHPRQRVPFFPRSECQPRAQPTHPDPNRSALHQAHLRSPILGPVTPEPGAPRLYRHVVGYGMPPTKLKRAAPVQHIAFTVSEATWKRLARNDMPLKPGEPPRRTLTEQSLNLRLRCCACPTNGFATESSWVIADGYWPEEMSFQLNGSDLETRRKLHHGRYLPIDLTEFIREGSNVLQITLNRMDRDLPKANFAVAVEAVGIMTHETIINNLKRISAAESLESIKRSLSGEDCGDDDIAVTSSTMTIKLTDPYSGCNMVNIPVRSSECLHYDCFDLEVFLGQCRRPHEGWPTIVDCWRCPLCRSDVRPQLLIVDEFLLEVRKNLAKQNAMDTRAIVVEADGSWKVKKEERKGVRSSSLEREERRKQSAATPTPAPKKVIEVIELLDD